MKISFARKLFLLLSCAAFLAAVSSASELPVGFLSLDNTNSAEPTTGQFDITNLTGSSALPPDFPITDLLTFSITSLVIEFDPSTGLSPETLTSSDFTSDGFGGFNGDGTFNLATDPILSVVLTGTFSPTTGLSSVAGGTILPDFTVTLTDPLGDLQPGDFVVIDATTGSSPPVIPEPAPWVLLGTGAVLLFLLSGRGQLSRRAMSRSALGGGLMGLLSVCILAPTAANAAVTLTTAAQPPSGLAGTGAAYVTGTGFPAGSISPATVTVSFAPTCLATTPSATASATQVRAVIGSTDRVNFTIPASLATGTYAVWLTGSSPAFTSGTCATLQVTGSTKKLSACIPSSSLAVLLGSTVTAYVPGGSWDGGSTGIGVVNLEGPALSTAIATPNVVNACSSNAVTGETVCTANNTDVYLISGTTLNRTLTSGAGGLVGFSGGDCENCGVAINASNNTAYIEEGVDSGVYGVQPLNLSTNAFSAPFPMTYDVSENIAIDPNLNLLLTPGEGGNYDILQVAPSGALSEFGNQVGGTLDSAAEDCTTGIALASNEFTNDIYIQDLTQAVYTPGTPGSYTAPGQFLTLNTADTSGFSAGTCGISEAPGSSHMAVVTGEFGGNTFAVLQLPSTSGSGTPALLDYAVTEIPANPAGGSSPCAGGFSAGLDPHTITAYTSPNDEKPYAVFADSTPSCVVRVDMGAILAASRIGGTNTVATPPASAFTYYAVTP